jgi:hypothetical protein
MQPPHAEAARLPLPSKERPSSSALSIWPTAYAEQVGTSSVPRRGPYAHEHLRRDRRRIIFHRPSFGLLHLHLCPGSGHSDDGGGLTVPNISRGRVATHWFLTREERKKEAPQEGLTPLGSSQERYTSRDTWTPQQDGLIRKVYPVSGSFELAQRFCRTPDAVQSRARFLGVKFVRAV